MKNYIPTINISSLLKSDFKSISAKKTIKRPVARAGRRAHGRQVLPARPRLAELPRHLRRPCKALSGRLLGRQVGPPPRLVQLGRQGRDGRCMRMVSALLPLKNGGRGFP